ncbi:DUF1566 domain-containing protein [Desulfovibrio inopinatus]|uniref:Lcl C-terminal domain-containing protein n=1 Tax=Desulfovibrio inopinatus TaxID=102109 RepID=UPI0004250EB7|nr:DUF1566 domain-containing protein [Desulfovibrio inopinatus]
MKASFQRHFGLLACLTLFLALGIHSTTYAEYLLMDDEVVDTTTQLTWMQSNDEYKRTWEEALDYCENLTLGGESTWRLPNIKELASLVNQEREAPAAHYFFQGKNSSYWSSTTVRKNGGDVSSAYIVNFYDGRLSSSNKTSQLYVRCVRSTQ